MAKSLLIAVLAIGLTAVASTAARADSCETFPGSQVYTDQNCGSNAGPSQNGTQAQPSSQAGQTGVQSQTHSLRYQLQRALSEGAANRPSGNTSSTALAAVVAAARNQVKQALDEASRASDPSQQQKARVDYTAAMAKLDRAYDAAADAASPQGAAELDEMKDGDDARFADAANRIGLFQPIVAAEPAQPAAPAAGNVSVENGFVYVCDGPVDSAHVACREVQPDGRQCLAVIAFDGDVNWRDSSTTPCSKSDIAQRDAFLAQNSDAKAEVATAAADPFAMDKQQQCSDLIQNYIAAAKANDGPGAEAGYEALQSVGGCDVLSQVQQQAAPAGGDPRFQSRGDTPMLDQTFGACDKSPQECDQLALQLKAGTSSAAIAAMYSNAIGIGLQLGSMMGNAVLNAQQLSTMRAPVTRISGGTRGAAPQYPRAISCNYSGCVTTAGPPHANVHSDVTGGN